jgi:uncharacterized phage-associated protein
VYNPVELTKDGTLIIPFNTMKSIQAVAVLLNWHEGRLTRLRLVKLLYIADRESIAETLRPVTGDDIVAMDHGPVPTRIYRLICHRDTESPLWDRYIAQQGDRDLVLIADPGQGKLSRYEIGKLGEVADRYRSLKDYKIADITHDFPEWEKNQPPEGSKQDIPLSDILSALGLSEYEDRIAAEQRAVEAFDDALGSLDGR